MSLFSRSAKTHAHTILRQTTTRNNFTRGFHSTIAKMVVHNIANKADFDSILKTNKVVVLDAFATWCGPCKVIAPKVVEFSDEFKGAHFVKLDVDEVPDVAQELGIRAMPTFLVFENGEKVKEVVGANPQALKVAIEKHAPVKAE